MFRFCVFSFGFLSLFVFLNFADAGLDMGPGEPPQDEDLMIQSWVEGLWESIPYVGGLSGDDFYAAPMHPDYHEGVLEDGVDFLLNPRIRFEAVSSAVLKSRRGDDLPYYFYEGKYPHRNYIVSQIAGIRAGCGGGPISLGYVAQQFRSLETAEKAAENVEGEWASTRFLAARFLNDLRLLKLMLQQERDPRVLTMLCIKASGHIAARGEGYEQLRKLVLDTVPRIRDPLLIRTLAMFCEEDSRILRRIASSGDSAAREIASWRLRNMEAYEDGYRIK